MLQGQLTNGRRIKGVDKITVIPNGAEIPEMAEKPENAPPRYIIYFGAVQAWQQLGVDLAAGVRQRLGAL